MKVSYDPELDAIYIELRDVRPADSKDIVTTTIGFCNYPYFTPIGSY